MKAALERELHRRDVEGEDVTQLRGQLDIVTKKLQESKVAENPVYLRYVEFFRAQVASL